MQLGEGAPTPLRTRLRAATFVLLAAGLPTFAGADPAPSPRWQLDATGLLYGERQRTDVIEPTGRLTRLFADGQTLSAQLAIDGITGASPTGAVPSNQPQTTTTASGTVTTQSAQIPTKKFNDLRGAADLAWELPVGSLFKATSGTHYSREKDYQSVGASESFSLDVLHRLATVTIGAGFNRDGVFPKGGTRVPLSDGTQVLTTGTDDKRVMTGLIGLSRVLSRRLVVGVNYTRAVEQGYLTEPYKVISVVDPQTLMPVGQLTESRPARRDRRAAMASSIYHLEKDVLYLEYRYYWDDWGIRSHTADAKYRVELPNDQYVLPHLRYYGQSPASFYRESLLQGEALPAFASADYRLGLMSGITVGATYGFRLPDSPGEWSIRLEYMRQWGPGLRSGPSGNAVAGGDDSSGAPGPVTGLDIGSLLVGYTIQF